MDRDSENRPDYTETGYTDETYFARSRQECPLDTWPSQASSSSSAWPDPSTSEDVRMLSGYDIAYAAPVIDSPGYDPLRSNYASSNQLQTSYFPSSSAASEEPVMMVEPDGSQSRGGAVYGHSGYHPRHAFGGARGHLGQVSPPVDWDYTPFATPTPSSASLGPGAASAPPDEMPPAKRRRVSAPPTGKGRASGSRVPRKVTEAPPNRRFHNMVDNSQSTMLPSGSMFITFPVEKQAAQPMEAEPLRVESCPPTFEHGPTELPPRPYPHEDRADDGNVDAPATPKKRRTLPSNVMDHLPTLEGRLCKIEMAAQEYIDYRIRRAVEKSILPGGLPER